MNAHFGTSGSGWERTTSVAGHGNAPALTPTQLKVLHGVHSGLLNKQIAFELGIAESTVKAHMTALMRKLNVRNRTQVAMAASMWSEDARRA
ncbi:DNA-binding response regulator [Sphingomonas ginkgonis]|uniref:DNA-binding response regulator n=1 Tax=Sphingomonas ginkgonis TaxID=2315330 RepID=A0A3R9WQ23_9SPHN|nr:LuxR C-terminal-related transcriptional regulator [Sphingomonas ginkgonis]RST30631.1 DNA-binding response regulator [Sphingomonas ginkgonis]